MLSLLVLEHHVVVGLQTDAGSEDVDDALSLLGQRVHHGRALGHLRSLQQVAEDGQHGVEVLEALAAVVRHRDTLADLR